MADKAQVPADAWSNYRTGSSNFVDKGPGKGNSYNEAPYTPGKGFTRSKGSSSWNVFVRPRTIIWKDKPLIPVRKNFAVEHPNVQARSHADCEWIRATNGIHVTCPTSTNIWDVPKPIECLEETPFPDWVIRHLRAKCWERPTPIQVQGWPVALGGHDLIGIAQTGSGKTMAYALPMLVHLVAQEELKPGQGPVGLVLVPTRELTVQVATEIREFADAGQTNAKVVGICGGEDEAINKQNLLDRCDVIVATPGRLYGLLERKATNLDRATYVVLDEADGLLEPSMQWQVEYILANIRPDRQLLLFTATYQETMAEFATTHCTQQPIEVNVGGARLSACKDISQSFWCCNRRDRGPGNEVYWLRLETKQQVLFKAVKGALQHCSQQDGKVLVFCNQIETVKQIADALRKSGIPGCDTGCEAFLSEAAKEQKAKLLESFQLHGSDLRVLVATNVLGRGHDFQHVKYVINYDMPTKIVDYVHRIGRTGRAGQKGFALTLLDETGGDLRWASDLLACLKESGQPQPQWLTSEAPAWKQRQHFCKYRDYNRARANGDTWQQEPNSFQMATYWNGRGHGMRQEFLQRLPSNLRDVLA